MSIRTRIFKSYLILIVLVLVYISLSFLLSSFRLQMEKDKNAILEVKNLWGEMLVYMNETVSNWNDGETFNLFLTDSRLFDEKLQDLEERIKSKRKSFWYREDINRHIINLNAVWEMAQVNVERISNTRESPAFRQVEKSFIQEPGLQRLYQVYMRLLGNLESGRHAYALKEYIDAVEFFPIYSDTVNHVFTVVLESMETQHDRVRLIQEYLSIIFFLTFLMSFVLVSTHFTASLSRPITSLSSKLNTFVGKTVERKTSTNDDEMAMLEHSVDDLIIHYTHLSELARRLAYGHIETSLLSLPQQGVVGDALKEVAAYLQELTQAAVAIREGSYGIVVEEKSDKDVLARSFNIMSRGIAEKISTLRNMFETIDEGILLADNQGKLIETNNKFLYLMGVDDLKTLNQSGGLRMIETENEQLNQQIQNGEFITDAHCHINNLRKEQIPIKLNLRPLSDAAGKSDGVMLLISNESVRVRMHREQEKLSAQAVEAELRALRAQINPHFFFNTLNTIAHLIETDSTLAVGVVEKLAGMFRYTLLSTKRSTVPLQEEIFHLQEFIAIEKIRNGERLSIDFSIAHEVKDAHIPPMLLQPIIENGIKYGADPNGNIEIQVFASKQKGTLLIEVSDNGQKEVHIPALLDNSRTGLKNVNHRLMTLYRRELEFSKPTGGGLKVKIQIPMSGGSL